MIKLPICCSGITVLILFEAFYQYFWEENVMKQLLPFMFAAILFFSASALFAMDPTGCIEGDCAPQEQVTPLTSDYCAAFTLEGLDFLLQIDESGHGHTLGAWCTD